MIAFHATYEFYFWVIKRIWVGKLIWSHFNLGLANLAEVSLMDWGREEEWAHRMRLEIGRQVQNLTH